MDHVEYITPKRASILDVAARAGVSRQTVTRAMNDMADISEITKQRVLAAAQELHYRPSRFGRGLVKQPTRTLALVVVDLRNAYYAELASSVLNAAADSGWNVLVTELLPGRDDVLEELSVQADAIVGNFEIEEQRLQSLFGDMPLVALDYRESSLQAGAIDFDFRPGMRAALTHLLASGRQHIAMLDSSRTGIGSRRGEAFDREARELAVTTHRLVIPVDFEPGMESGRAGVKELLETHPDIDAVICFNDEMALGAMKQLRSHGVAVPRDVSVIGIDGLPIGTMVTPELTTLALDMKLLGVAAMELVVGMSVGDIPLHGPSARRVLTHTLLLRESA